MRAGPRALPFLLSTAGIASLALHEALAWGIPRHSPWYAVLLSSFPAQLFQFVPGLALACLHVLAPTELAHRILGAVRWAPLLGAVLLPLAWLSPVVGTALPLETVDFACLAAPVFLGRAGVAARLLAGRPAVAVGVISYSLYLWHWPVIGFLGRVHLWHPEGLAWNLALTLLVALSVSAASYAIVERPFMRPRLTWARTPQPTSITPALETAPLAL